VIGIDKNKECLKRAKKMSVKYLKDYQPPDFLIPKLELSFNLEATQTIVTSKLFVEKNPRAHKSTNNLVLDGQDLKLKNIKLNGEKLKRNCYKISQETLTIFEVPSRFILETEVAISPSTNTSLYGLYLSGNNYCTQCEPYGFRRITYFIDRPDVLTSITTTIIADREKFPILLSNGNLVKQKKLQKKHLVKWHDPSLKPVYLFALVAGDFSYLEKKYLTKNNRQIKLRIYAAPGKIKFASHALQSLIDAMRWEEKKFGLTYELDFYSLVAIDDFNVAAMENKGLNIFDSKYLLVSPEIATDQDYLNVARVVAHEYFHNWSGNRVTCRDWFQLSLKEGLTTLRENWFMQDYYLKGLQRIEEAQVIKNQQFAEDAGPAAHPVQPKSYLEINNFYTYTIYNKGAEVVRMLKTIFGERIFIDGVSRFLHRFDGQAVTIEDFLLTMRKVTNFDLKQFRNWYDQPGTPLLRVQAEYDQKQKTYRLKIHQNCPKAKAAFLIPLTISLKDQNGQPLIFQYQKKKSFQQVLLITKRKESFVLKKVRQIPIISLLRDFSAPVKIKYQYRNDQLLKLFLYEDNIFNRWEIGQQIFAERILALAKLWRLKKKLSFPNEVKEIFTYFLTNKTDKKDPLILSALLKLPEEKYLFGLEDSVDIEAICAARAFLKKSIAKNFQKEFLAYYFANRTNKYFFDLDNLGKRSFKNLCLDYLISLDDQSVINLAYQQYCAADNITDLLAAINALVNSSYTKREEILSRCYKKWRKDSLLLEKWLRINSQIKSSDALKRVRQLTKHNSFDYKNPAKVYALLGNFSLNNHLNFHRRDGKGYDFLAQEILKIDQINPQVAARLVSPLLNWRKFDSLRRKMMHQSLQKIFRKKNLSKNVYELVKKGVK
jgi:aminopeptidase N